jgi:5'-nucleotidase
VRVQPLPRAVASLRQWGVTVNDAFFLGGIDKASVIGVLRPHIFFDDQERHLQSTSLTAPSVHVPFGIANVPTNDMDGDRGAVRPDVRVA